MSRRMRYRNRVRSVKKMVNYIPRSVCSYDPVYKPMHKVTLKLQYNQLNLYEYGNKKFDDKCSEFLWTAMWDTEQHRLNGLKYGYARFAINKVKLVISNVRLRILSYSISGKDIKAGRTIPDLSAFDDYNDKRAHLLANSTLTTTTDDYGEGDGSRNCVFWFNNTCVKDSLPLQIQSCEHAKKRRLRRGLKLRHTIYCKPKNYVNLARSSDQVPAALTILQEQNSPKQVTEAQIFFGPLLDSTEPSKDDISNLMHKVFTWTCTAYVYCTFTGCYPDLN